MVDITKLVEGVVGKSKKGFVDDAGNGFVPEPEYSDATEIPSKEDMPEDEDEGLSAAEKNSKIRKIVDEDPYGKVVKEDSSKDDEDEDEDKEDLEELSKDTLGKYIQGSSRDASKQFTRASKQKTGSAGQEKNLAAGEKRMSGIAKAAGKMADKNYGSGIQPGTYKKGDFGDYSFVARSKNGLVRYFKSAKGALDHANSMREEVEKLTANDFNVSEDINAIFGSNDQLSEEFVSQATRIYEAAIVSKANEVVENVVAKLEEQFESEKEFFVEEITTAYEEKLEEMVETLDRYLNKVVSEWRDENAVQLEAIAKYEIAESFMGKMKTLFEDHYIDIPEGKLDVLEAQESKLEEMEARLNEEIERNISLSEKLEESYKENILKKVSVGLSESQKDKMRSLSEAIDYVDEESFTEKLSEIKENYFPKKAIVTKLEESDSPIVLKEETAVKNTSDPVMASVSAISARYFSKK